jgi:hypothetical protein
VAKANNKTISHNGSRGRKTTVKRLRSAASKSVKTVGTAKKREVTNSHKDKRFVRLDGAVGRSITRAPRETKTIATHSEKANAHLLKAWYTIHDSRNKGREPS